MVDDNVVKKISELTQKKRETKPVDTEATVTRVEDGICWVHVDGGAAETPCKLTIDAQKGDVVQIRIKGKKAWLVGNKTAPPTDDKAAKQALKKIELYTTEINQKIDETAEKLGEEINEIPSVEGVTTQWCLCSSNADFNATTQYGDWSDDLPAYVSPYYYWTRTVITNDDGETTYSTPQFDQTSQTAAEVDASLAGTQNHFWYTNTGAYVTSTDQETYQDDPTGYYAERITSGGIFQLYGENLLSSWTNSGINFYKGDAATAALSTILASLGSSGLITYTNGTRTLSIAEDMMHFYRTNGDEVGRLFFNENTSEYRIGLAVEYASQGYKYAALGTLAQSTGSLTYLTSEFGTSSSYERGELGVTEDSLYVRFYTGYSSSLTRVGYFSIDSSGNVLASGSVSAYGITSFGSVSASGAVSGASGSFSGTVSAAHLVATSPSEGTSATANCRLLSSAGVATYEVGFTQGGTSSRKVKHDIKQIEDPELDPHRLYDVDVVQFVYNEGHLCETDCRHDKPLAGFIAEDLLKIYPTAVDVIDGTVESWNDKFLIPPMLALIQEQNDRITELERRIA